MLADLSKGMVAGPAGATSARLGAPAALVLDTNIVLDWLVFDDPDVVGVRGAITSGRMCWVASPTMRDELESVLARGSLLAWRPDPGRIWSTWHRWATMVAPRAMPPVHQLRCTDPDDQKFVELALQVGASALLSRDRALLRLAGRARDRGLAIMTSAAWASTHAS